MKINNLASYARIVEKLDLDKIRAEAEKLGDKHILYINSTYQGGGVAEILNSLVPLFDQVGIDFGWRILDGGFCMADFAWHSGFLHYNREVP